MQNEIQILSTKKMSDTLIRIAGASGICIDQIPFIETKGTITPSLQKKLEKLSGQNITVVFTSVKAVNSVSESLQKKVSWKIYCIEPGTKKAVEKNFGSGHIAGAAENATQLASRIISDQSVKKIVFFCGDKRRDVLREELKKNGIGLEEIIVYRTTERPVTISKTYKGILFFSPSAVHSFFSKNKVDESTQLFAIGATTADAIKNFSTQPVIISEHPSAEELIRRVITYFTTKKPFNAAT